MEATWAATQTAIHELVVRQLKDSDDSDDLTTTTSKATGKKADGNAVATSTSSTKGAKSTSLYKQADKWVNNNPTIIISACVLGISGVILGALGIWCYLRIRNRKRQLAMENLEVEAGRMAIEEKERARMEAEAAAGTYPHFGASNVPLKQQTTFGDDPYDEGFSEHPPSYKNQPVAKQDSLNAYKLDDIPDELGPQHHPSKEKESYISYDDEEEDLRDSQMKSSNGSHQQDNEVEAIQDTSDDGHSGGRRARNASPASNLSGTRPNEYEGDPRLARPELRRMAPHHSDTVDTMDSDARDSVYSVDDRTKYT